MPASQEYGPLDDYLLDLSSIPRTPDITTFTSHRDMMTTIVDAFKKGHAPVSKMDMFIVNPRYLADSYTMVTTIYGSGLDGNTLDDPQSIIDKIVANLSEIISKVTWHSLYNSYKNQSYPAMIDKTIFNFLGIFKITRKAQYLLKNGADFETIIKDEQTYRILESMIERGVSVNWFMSSTAALQIATMKRWDGRYFINQRDYGLRQDGVMHQIFNEDIVYDEWLDDIELENSDKHSKIFIGDLRYTIGYSISNNLLIERIPIMMPRKDSRDSEGNDLKPYVRDVTITQPDGDFIPGIQYNITMKIKPHTTPYARPWMILDVDYSKK